MENMQLVTFVLAVCSLIIGGSLYVGLGWVVFLIDLLNRSVSADYADLQRTYPGSKKNSIIGILFIVIGIILALASVQL